MRVLILWASDDSTNLGVRALGAGAEALACRAWPGAEVDFLTFGSTNAPIRLGEPRTLVRELSRPHGAFVEWLREYDVVLDTRGGDSFADIYGMKRHLTMSLVGEAVGRARRPYVMAPQTIGPFHHRRGRILARRTLARADLVMARDSESADLARRLGQSVDTLTTDVVFALDRPVPDAARDVVLNVSGLLWTPGPHVDASRYRRALADIYRYLLLAGRRVTLLAHVLASPLADNDVPAIAAFADAVGHDGEVLVPTSLDEARAALAGSQLVIGSRMHACLNALSVGTPALPLAYSRKFAPLLRDIGWDFSIDMRTADRPQDMVREAVERGISREGALRSGEQARMLLGRAVESLRLVA